METSTTIYISPSSSSSYLSSSSSSLLTSLIFTTTTTTTTITTTTKCWTLPLLWLHIMQRRTLHKHSRSPRTPTPWKPPKQKQKKPITINTPYKECKYCDGAKRSHETIELRTRHTHMTRQRSHETTEFCTRHTPKTRPQKTSNTKCGEEAEGEGYEWQWRRQQETPHHAVSDWITLGEPLSSESVTATTPDRQFLNWTSPISHSLSHFFFFFF